MSTERLLVESDIDWDQPIPGQKTWVGDGMVQFVFESDGPSGIILKSMLHLRATVVSCSWNFSDPDWDGATLTAAGSVELFTINGNEFEKIKNTSRVGDTLQVPDSDNVWVGTSSVAFDRTSVVFVNQPKLALDYSRDLGGNGGLYQITLLLEAIDDSVPDPNGGRWRNAEEGELLADESSIFYQGDGVFLLADYSSPTSDILRLSSSVPVGAKCRVSVSSYLEQSLNYEVDVGSRYYAASIYVRDSATDEGIISYWNYAYGSTDGFVQSHHVVPTPEWVDVMGPAEFQNSGNIEMVFNPTSYTGDGLKASQWLLSVKLEIESDEEPAPEPGECFWTALTRVTQVCGDIPPPPPASISVIGADVYGNRTLSAGNMDWEDGSMPTFLEGDYVPAEAINVLANITGTPQNVPDYCGVSNSAGIVGDKIVVLNQTLGCGSYYYDRSSVITGNWKSLFPPKSIRQNPGQIRVVDGSLFAVGTVSAGGQLRNSTVFIALLPDTDTPLSSGAKVQFNPPMQSTLTVSEAEKTYGLSSFETMMDAGEMCVTVAANGDNWAGGAGNFSVDCQLFIRPPVYSVSAGVVTDMVFYRGATISIDSSSAITVEGAGDPVSGVFDGVTMNVYEDANQSEGGTTYRSGHNFVLPDNGNWSDYSQDEGVVVGDLYLVDSADGPQTFVGKVAFTVGQGGGDDV